MHCNAAAADCNDERLGDLPEPTLRQALEGKPTLEVYRCVQAVLEDIDTPAAHRLLEELAADAAEAKLTREAKASLERLNRRSTGK